MKKFFIIYLMITSTFPSWSGGSSDEESDNDNQKQCFSAKNSIKKPDIQPDIPLPASHFQKIEKPWTLLEEEAHSIPGDKNWEDDRIEDDHGKKTTPLHSQRATHWDDRPLSRPSLKSETPLEETDANPIRSPLNPTKKSLENALNEALTPHNMKASFKESDVNPTRSSLRLAKKSLKHALNEALTPHKIKILLKEIDANPTQPSLVPMDPSLQDKMDKILTRKQKKALLKKINAHPTQPPLGSPTKTSLRNNLKNSALKSAIKHEEEQFVEEVMDEIKPIGRKNSLDGWQPKEIEPSQQEAFDKQEEIQIQNTKNLEDYFVEVAKMGPPPTDNPGSDIDEYLLDILAEDLGISPHSKLYPIPDQPFTHLPAELRYKIQKAMLWFWKGRY